MSNYMYNVMGCNYLLMPNFNGSLLIKVRTWMSNCIPQFFIIMTRSMEVILAGDRFLTLETSLKQFCLRVVLLIGCESNLLKNKDGKWKERLWLMVYGSETVSNHSQYTIRVILTQRLSAFPMYVFHIIFLLISFPLLSQTSMSPFQMVQKNRSLFALLHCLNPQSNYNKFPSSCYGVYDE